MGHKLQSNFAVMALHRQETKRDNDHPRRECMLSDGRLTVIIVCGRTYAATETERTHTRTRIDATKRHFNFIRHEIRNNNYHLMEPTNPKERTGPS